MTTQYLCASGAVRKELARIHDADKGILSRTSSKITWSYDTKCRTKQDQSGMAFLKLERAKMKRT